MSFAGKKRVKTVRISTKITCVRSGKVIKIPRYKRGRARDSEAAENRLWRQSEDAESDGPRHMDDGVLDDENLLDPVPGERSEVITHRFDGENLLPQNCQKNRYYHCKIKEVVKWKELRVDIQEGFVEGCCLPLDESCYACHEKPSCENGAMLAETRCLDCGTGLFMCKECCLDKHEKQNKFHYLEKWQDGTFVPLDRPPITIELARKDHISQLCAISCRSVDVIDQKGSQFGCIMEFCNCKPDCYFFIKQRIWPSTPVFPRMGFKFEFMNLLESFFIESQVSVSSFCSSINLLTPLIQKITSGGKNILKALQGESFEEYRFFKHKISTLTFLNSELDEGSLCPACPLKGPGVIVESIDACFGLVHKKAAGKYTFDPKLGSLKIVDDREIDAFMSSYPSTRTSTKDCNNFQAGSLGQNDSIMSKGKSKAYDVKGIIGSICRHEVPQQFMNLKHGERIGYSVFLIKKKLNELENQPELKYCVLYDIACILQKHLQAILGTRRVQNIGLSDGEQCERLWSYLRCFSSITKEMTEDHRKDVLTSALVHYGRKSSWKLPVVLPRRMEKAKKTADSCREQLQELLSSSTTDGSEEMVLNWIREEKELLSKNRKVPNTANESVYVQYVRELLANRQIRQLLMMEDSTESDIAANVQILRRSEKELSKIEKQCAITQRWNWSNETAKKIVVDLILAERKELVETLRTLAHERKFLLKMKRLYANGQKLAKTLSISIGKKNKNITTILLPFNRKVRYLSKEIKELRKQDIDIDEAKNYSADLYSNLSHHQIGHIPAEVKQEAIDMYCRLKRAEEEKLLVESEMKNTVMFYSRERDKTVLTLKILCSDTLLDRGAVALLSKHLKILNHMLECLVSSFASIIDIDIAVENCEEGQETFLTVEDSDEEVDNEEEALQEIEEDDNELEYFDY